MGELSRGAHDCPMAANEFYDDLAPYYDLVYADWEGSMERQGRALHRMLQAQFPGEPEGTLRILDASAGIGTQAIPLARLGYRMVARDLSPRAITRLSREAEERGLEIDAAPADMRRVSETVQGGFHAVIAMDNSVPHLRADEDILRAFQEFRSLLVDRGAVLVSVRDYDNADRAPTSVHPYGVRKRGDRTFRLEQQWNWTDAEHYVTTFLLWELREGSWTVVTRSRAAYYAISIPRLLELMSQAGFQAREVKNTSFFQPVLAGRIAG